MPTGFICGPVHIVEKEIVAKEAFDHSVTLAAKQGNVLCIESDAQGVQVHGYIEADYTIVHNQKLLPFG